MRIFPGDPPSSCDSSDCAYCQFMSERRRWDASSPGFCWLRRKRSETDLAELSRKTEAGNVPSEGIGDKIEEHLGVYRTVPGTREGSVDDRFSSTSIWNHALVEPEDATSLLVRVPIRSFRRQKDHWEHRGIPMATAYRLPGDGTPWRPWRWSPSLEQFPNPISSISSEIVHCIGNIGRNSKSTSILGTDAAAIVRQTDIVSGLEWEQHGWLLASAGVSKQVKVFSLAQSLDQIEQMISSPLVDVSNERSNCTGSCNPSELPLGSHSHISRYPDDDRAPNGRASRSNGIYSHEAPIAEPLRVHRLASKLSSLSWNPDAPGVVTLGDYDGGINQLDLETGHLVAEIDGHQGRRVWSVSHSYLRPHFAASGSEDGTVGLWSGYGLNTLVHRIHVGRAHCSTTRYIEATFDADHPCGWSWDATRGTRDWDNNICVTSVQLSPFDENTIAVACADAYAFIFDLRRAEAPLLALKGHDRPLSHIKFMDRDTIITAATDSSIMQWKITSSKDSARCVDQSSRQTKRFKGHKNKKNFVGLSIRPEGRLIACGSEDASAFVYCTAWERPVVEHWFSTRYLSDRAEFSDVPAVCDDYFCSAVAWQPAVAHNGPPILAAATSDGKIRMLSLMQAQDEISEGDV